MDFKKTFGSIDPTQLAQWYKWHDSEFLIAPTETIAFRNETLRTFSVADISADGLAKKTAMEVVELESGIKAKTVLLDWKNIFEGEREIPYSVDKATEYLTHYDDFRMFVDEKAEALSIKQQKQTAQSKKK